MRFLEATSLNTDNSIYTQQNNDFIIKCLVAQRSEYSKAKTINRCKTILTLSVALISILASIINNDVLSAISGLLAVILLIVNKWSERTIMVNAVKVFTLRLCISAYYIHFKRVKVKIFTAFTIALIKNMRHQYSNI